MEFIVLTENELTFGSSGGDKSDNRHFVYDFESWCKRQESLKSRIIISRIYVCLLFVCLIFLRQCLMNPGWSWSWTLDPPASTS